MLGAQPPDYDHFRPAVASAILGCKFWPNKAKFRCVFNVSAASDDWKVRFRPPGDRLRRAVVSINRLWERPGGFPGMAYG